jgi:hypothetical protein
LITQIDALKQQIKNGKSSDWRCDARQSQSGCS